MEIGAYDFRICEYCYGPMFGHLKEKCPKVEYSYDDVEKFERYIENIGGFQEAIWKRKKIVYKRNLRKK